jgi:tripartite-type tricarboxylate transporter receptor subunit TctC
MHWAKTLAALAVAGAAASAAAQDYPARPIQMIIPFAAGGGFDQTSRNFAQALAEVLKQPIAAVNVDGAAGSVGLTRLSQAVADGYIVGMTPAVSLTSEPHRNRNLAYGMASFRPVCQVFENIFAVMVPKDSPYKTLADLVAEGKRNPGTLSYGTSGTGSIPHLAVADIEAATGAVFNHAPYRGDGPMQLDLVGGRLNFGGALPSSFIAQVRAGNLRLLAVMPERRHPAFPDVPTLTELGIPVVQPSFGGLIVPAATPAPVVATLEAACDRAMQSPALKAWAAGANQVLNYAKSAEFAARLKRDSEVKEATIKRLKLSAQ